MARMGFSPAPGVKTHAQLPDVSTPHVLADLESAVCSETEAGIIAAALIAAENHPIIVRKTADKTLNNVDTLENDNHLLLAIGANEIWQIDIWILCSGEGAADIQFGFSYPVDCVIRWSTIGAGGAVFDDTWGYSSAAISPEILEAVDSLAMATHSLAKETGYRLSLLVINGANAGNVNLQWAQATADVSDTKVLTNSCMIAHQIA